MSEIEEIKTLTDKLKGDDFERTVIEAYKMVFTERTFKVVDTNKIWKFTGENKMDNGYFIDTYFFYVSNGDIFLKFTNDTYIYKTFSRQASNNEMFVVELLTLDGKEVVLEQVEE